MTRTEANKALAPYGAEFVQVLPYCVTIAAFGTETRWYTGQTPEDVIAAYRNTHGY